MLLAAPIALADPSRLSQRTFVVVAVIDSGINPYHVDFRRPDLLAHPATYVTGYPRSAKRLALTLNARTFQEALARDEHKWGSVRPDELVWIPGTNVIGALGRLDGRANFLDETGHGTAVASLAGGRIHGPETDNVLFIAIRGGVDGLRWAANQPWIDIITNSWSEIGPNPRQDAEASRLATENGKVVCFASGNLAVPLWVLGSQGPSWNVNVGAASARTRGEHAYSGHPNDVLGLSLIKAADHESIDGEVDFGGTSAATPNVCGQIARVLGGVRRALGHYRQGSTSGLARGRAPSPYLKDGCLDRSEFEDAVQATAAHAQTSAPDPDDPFAIPALPLVQFVRGGYGIVDHDSASRAVNVLLGREPRPTRDLEDAWIAMTNRMRDAIWGEAPEPPPSAVAAADKPLLEHVNTPARQHAWSRLQSPPSVTLHPRSFECLTRPRHKPSAESNVRPRSAQHDPAQLKAN